MAELYPDVAPAGDLRSALQARCDAPVHHVPSPGWRHVGAEVRNGERKADVVMGNTERVFTVQFWLRGVRMASGATDDLSAVAGALDGWHDGLRVGPLVEAWPFVSTHGFAEAFERGDAEAIEHRWQSIYRNTSNASQLTRVHPFITLAFQQPRLRELLPYTSHWNLHFSRTVTYPYSPEFPTVVPLDDGRYRVVGADRRELGTADAAGAVALVVAALPRAD